MSNQVAIEVIEGSSVTMEVVQDGGVQVVEITAPSAVEVVEVIHPGPQGPIGTPLPVGGNPGDVLLKDSYANYDAAWATTLDGGTFF